MPGRKPPILSVLLNIAIIAVISIVGLEGLSYLAVRMMADSPGNEHLKVHAAKFHPLFRREAEAALNPTPLYQRTDARNPFIFDPHTGYAIRPNAPYGPGLHTDAQGFVCLESCDVVTMAKPADEFRVMVVGGSTVVGFGVEDPKATMVAQLQRLMAARLPDPRLKLRVINSGVGGFFSAQELTRLNLELILYAPDLIVVFDGYNDANQWYYVNFYPHIERYRNLIKPNFHSYDYSMVEGIQRLQTPGGAVLHTLNLVNEAMPVLYYTTLIAKQARSGMAGWRGTGGTNAVGQEARRDYGESLATTARNSVTTYMENLRSMEGVARTRGIPIAFFLQPALPVQDADGRPYKKELAESEKALSDWVDRAPAFSAWYRSAREAFARRATDGGADVMYRDLTERFQAETEIIYVDEIHYNARGQAMLAESLDAALDPMSNQSIRRRLGAK